MSGTGQDNDMDDLGAAISAAMDSAPASPVVATDATPSPEAAPAAAPAQTDAERARDDQGRFKAKDETEVKAEAVKVDPAAPVIADPAKPAAAAVTPPTNWKGNGKIEFGRLPAAIQKEITDDYSRLSQTQAQLDELNAAIGPQRAQALAATYGSVGGALKSLLAMSDMASQDAPGFVRWFCQQRGINLSQITGQQEAPGDEPAQPQPWQQEMSQLKTMVQNFVQQQQQGTQTQITNDIDRFAADPAHPYYNDVYPQIKALLRDVVTEGSPQERLQKAYDMAVWANPETRTALITQERQRLTDEDAARVQQARNASVSISGSPQGAKVAADESDDDLEGVIRKQVARLS